MICRSLTLLTGYSESSEFPLFFYVIDDDYSILKFDLQINNSLTALTF